MSIPSFSAKPIFKTLFILQLLWFNTSCKPDEEKGLAQEEVPTKVEIRKSEDGRYNFYVADTLYDLKGAGLSYSEKTDFNLLKKSGANTFRTWSAANADVFLDSALKHGLMVAVGLDMDKELHGFDYTDKTKVAEQFKRIKREVQRYKNHPAVFSWVVGNELNLLFKPDGSLKMVNPKVYIALCDILNFVKTEDPNHPVTTTFAGLNPDHVKLALDHCTSMDYLSYQVYGDLKYLPDMERQLAIDLPFVVTEYGPNGHWEVPKTTWGREIEENSTQKALGLRDRLKKGFTMDTSGRNLGGFAFLWGQKQERTPTWYGLFNKDGRSIASVDELAYFWSGQYPANRAPGIEKATLAGKKAVESIVLKPGGKYKFSVKATDENPENLRYSWQLMTEVQERSDGGAYEKEPETIKLEIITEEKGSITFIAPEVENEYRIFAYVYDQQKVGNANIPFVVKK